MKKIIALTAISLFAVMPAAFAQDGSNNNNADGGATYPAAGGAAGASSTEVLAYSGLAAVGAAAAIGAAFAVADSGSDDKNVQIGGTGTTGTTGTR